MKIKNGIALMIMVIVSHPLLALSITEAIQMKWQSSDVLTAQKSFMSTYDGLTFRRYLPTSPQLQLTQGDDNTWSAIGASTSIAFPFKSAALSDSDASAKAAMALETQAKQYDYAVLVAQSYVDYSGIKAQLAAQANTLQDLETLEKSIQSLYQQGYASLSDTIGIKLQVSQVQAEFLDLQGREMDARRRLETVLCIPITATTSVTLDDDLDPRIISELQKPSGITRAESALKLAEATRRTLDWQLLPDLNLAIQRNRYSYLPASPSGADATLTFTASVTLPLFAPFSEGVDLRRQQLVTEMDRLQATESLRLAQADATAARQEYQRKKVRLQRIRETELPLAEAQVATTFSGYKVGKSGFAELIQARKTLIELKLLEIQLRSSVILAHLRSL